MNATATARASAAPNIRWGIKRDLPEMLAIEELSFPWPWTEDDFIRVLGGRNGICRVAEVNERVVGYAVYWRHRKHLEMLTLAVHPTYRRWGVGSALIAKLKWRLNPTRQNRLEATVWERNVDAQMFLRACGFRAVGIVSRPWDWCEDDGYRFELRVI